MRENQSEDEYRGEQHQAHITLPLDTARVLLVAASRRAGAEEVYASVNAQPGAETLVPDLEALAFRERE